MKKLIAILSSFLLLVAVASPVLAAEPSASPARGQKRENIVQKIQKFIGRGAKVVNGELKAISGNTLTVAKDGQDYTVNVTDKTKLRRRFWGKSTLDEFSVGDKISVYGKWANEEKTAIDAQLVRNLSIQKRNGTFFGTISSIDGMTVVIKTEKRGEQKVTLNGTTKIVNRKMQTMKASDLKADDKIRVKGLWDRNLNIITEVTQVKDFTQPVIAKPSPSPSGQ